MTDKNKRGFWIKAKGHEKMSDTIPEQAFQDFAESLGWTITPGEPKRCLDSHSNIWTLRPDFDLVLGSGAARVNIVILIDGRYHFTDWQEKKDRWRDEMYTNVGLKVIHIDAGLTLKRWWPYLREQFHKAVISKDRVTYIHE